MNIEQGTRNIEQGIKNIEVKEEKDCSIGDHLRNPVFYICEICD